MITAEIMGGLGNQMHILFTLIAYSLNNKIAFYLEDKLPQIGPRTVVYWNNMFQHLAKFLKEPMAIGARIKEKNLNFSPLPKAKKDITIKLFGYFQSFKYYELQKENILRFMKFDEIIEPYKNLYDYSNSISLHFRLGDYKALQGFHPIMPILYYENALNTMISVTGNENWQVLYFCEDEDIIHVEEQIGILSEKVPSVQFLRANPSLHDWEQMIVMSLCQHNIIANSSFSWWAAYLNNHENKKVICPNVILGPEAKASIKLEDRYPESWTVLTVE